LIVPSGFLWLLEECIADGDPGVERWQAMREQIRARAEEA